MICDPPTPKEEPTISPEVKTEELQSDKSSSSSSPSKNVIAECAMVGKVERGFFSDYNLML